MHNLRRFFESFRVRVTLALILAIFLMGVASDIAVQRIALRAQFEQLRENLMTTASAIASSVDADEIASIPMDRSGVEAPAFRALFDRFLRLKQENPLIGFVYVLKPAENPLEWQFVVDADPYLAYRKGVTAYPGDRYDVTRFPEISEALRGPVAEKKVQPDDWGTMLSGYAPVRDKSGKAVAVVGVDTLASDISRMQKKIHASVLLAFVAGLAIFLPLGIWFSTRLTASLRTLSDGIRRVSGGDLSYRITVTGHDEISELSRSFNQMAADLAHAYQKNQDYFYGIIRTLVMIVEARDPYTRGHSERVSEFAVEIAKRLGFSPERLEMLKQTAILHDIGKLGIHEAILSKKEKLTEAEWELLRNHPMIGEDILKPVLLGPEMLAAVRGHHERHDGNGYPDKLAGEDIHVFARILSVADAYDAMTSKRLYRQVLSQESAVAELRKHSGTQFDPQIVDIFIAILKERKSAAS